MTNVVGVQARVDDIADVGIFTSFKRQIIGIIQDAGVVESSGAVYGENTVQWSDALRMVIGIREDQFGFGVKDKMCNAAGSCTIFSGPLGCDSGNRRASIFSPKFGVVFGAWAKTTFFVNVGDGYHGNDARGVTRSGQNPEQTAVTLLTRARSAEVGLASKLLPN